MKALDHYRMGWTIWAVSAFLVVGLFIIALLTRNSLMSFFFLAPFLCIPIGGAFGLFFLIVNVISRLETNIKTENIGLHQFNMGEAARPKDLFITGVDKCLESGMEPKELVTILRERYEAGKR